MENDVQLTIADLLKRVEKLERDQNIDSENIDRLQRRVYELEHLKEKERRLRRELEEGLSDD